MLRAAGLPLMLWQQSYRCGIARVGTVSSIQPFICVCFRRDPRTSSEWQAASYRSSPAWIPYGMAISSFPGARPATLIWRWLRYEANANPHAGASTGP
jgi:hypothetical protein